MGNNICCSQQDETKQKIKVVRQKKAVMGTPVGVMLGEMSSTSQSHRQSHIQTRQPVTQIIRTPVKSLKSIDFTSYLNQKQVTLSQIKLKLSTKQESCSQQKIILTYLQRLCKQIQTIRKQNDPKLYQAFMDRNRNQNLHFNQKKFLQHAGKCPVCNQLFQSLRNVDVEQSHKRDMNDPEQRKSMRDSLLEFVQEDKIIQTEESKYLHLHSYQEAKKAMRKYPNSNNYQCKRLRFRKTSGFEREINQV